MPKDKSVRMSDYQALADFRYRIRCFVRFSEDAARQLGVEPQHHQLMLAIKGRADGEVPRIAYLAERLQIQHHSAVELVDRLEKKGLISRTRGDEDRREVHVQLTPQGEHILEELTQHLRAELQFAAPALVESLQKLTVGNNPPSRSRLRRERTAANGRKK
jgi:DNA-binding MarR family transcriptional regulator